MLVAHVARNDIKGYLHGLMGEASAHEIEALAEAATLLPPIALTRLSLRIAPIYRRGTVARMVDAD